MHGGCQTGNSVRAQLAGPCRVDCLHRSLVERYRAEKAADDEARKIAREKATYTDLDEGAGWNARHPGLTFRRFLIDNAQPGEH